MTDASIAHPHPGADLKDPLSRWADLLGPPVLAFVIGTVAWLVGLHGTDLAAQAYRSEVFRLHGIVIWDDGWYGGNFPLGYSVLSPVLGAVLGLGVLTVTASTIATACFDRIVVDLMGRRTLGSWYFAVSTLLAVTIGQVPYLAGEAAALGAVVALLNSKKVLAVVLGVLAVLLSPLAGAFLVMACVVWAVYDQKLRVPALVVAAFASVVAAALGLAFPGNGPFPFAWGGLVAVELLCATVLSPLVRANRPVRLAAGLYGLASLGSFFVANPIGGNAARLAESVGIPVVACLVTAPAGWKPRVPAVPWLSKRFSAVRPAFGIVVLIPFLIWQWAPGTGVVNSELAATAPSTTAAFYRPLVTQMLQRSEGSPRRVEVVPTLDHWESYYVAPYVSLARGWERQLDVQDNPIFYVKGTLTPASYHAWLIANGITWVALPAASLDYAGKAEAALLGSGSVPGLNLVWSDADWRLWRVVASPGLLSGPGRLTTLAPDRIELEVNHPGTLLLRVRYSSYWRLMSGAACVTSTTKGWTEVHATHAGDVRLGASLISGPSATCPTPKHRGPRAAEAP